MRVVVFFDLPTETSEQRREYTSFRKFLLRNGFVMMQESVYSKIVLNATAATAVQENVRSHKTSGGLIQMLIITERQFERMEFVVGEGQHEVVDSDEKLVIL
jgi:CRISPR-associated protein Cas2